MYEILALVCLWSFPDISYGNVGSHEKPRLVGAPADIRTAHCLPKAVEMTVLLLGRIVRENVRDLLLYCCSDAMRIPR
jgi:hypothetical protein